MDCPRLRSVGRLRGHLLAHATAMPQLEEVRGSFDPSRDPAWLPRLVASSPRLRRLSHVSLSQAMLAQLFAGCPSLASLRTVQLHLATASPPRFVLRLPEHLEALDGSVTVAGCQGARPAELRVEAPGLRVLRLDAPSHVQLTIACPALVALAIPKEFVSSFALAEETQPPLRSLRLAYPHVRPSPPLMQTSTDSLLAVLRRHGRHLQQVSLPSARLSAGAWPQVAAALEQLPMLTSLELDEVPAADLTLSLPRLSSLAIRPRPSFGEEAVDLRSLVLDCPRLEVLTAPFDSRLQRFELAGEGEASGRHIGYIGSVEEPWWERLQARFPNAFLSSSLWW
ncbi:hypothetical protein PAPYR_7837 [Paratrimastix pyriformis]|uniref:Uncharacterized protein n=1 Tax=Paratrimastix pyriformis TaxID=342808 RepID=A0ABQ8UFB8_9EUKA|nr:hypothetical protein PAPYR_7837 [Paratrimastix pyriformis]